MECGGVPMLRELHEELGYGSVGKELHQYAQSSVTIPSPMLQTFKEAMLILALRLHPAASSSSSALDPIADHSCILQRGSVCMRNPGEGRGRAYPWWGRGREAQGPGGDWCQREHTASTRELSGIFHP